MRVLFELVKSKYVMALAALMVILLGMAFYRDFHKNRGPSHLPLSERTLHKHLFHTVALSNQPVASGSLAPSQAAPSPTDSAVNSRLDSYTTVDAREGGHRVCVCPIDKTVFIHKQMCSATKCPVCHRELLEAVYAGDGYLNAAIR